jgi:glycosyltransferase involved in cell wall biosynthesis
MGCFPQKAGFFAPGSDGAAWGRADSAVAAGLNNCVRECGAIPWRDTGYSPTSKRRHTAYDDFVVNKELLTSAAPLVSIGIIAWNEEQGIGAMLESVFQQSIFAELGKRGRRCEIICVTNGCTDRTPEVVAEIFARRSLEHPDAGNFSCRVMNVSERGKINAWNRFVHTFSARDAKYLFLMDADILIHPRETLWNMVATLEKNTEASISVDLPRKDISFKQRKTLWERMSMGASQMTGSASAQLCGQLYCIRSEVARNIYLPRDLCACDDGFIKALVCTDFLMHRVWPWRIVAAAGAAHTFEAYVSPAVILKNQKRQMIGQTIVHVLVDDYLKKLPVGQRMKLAEALSRKEQADPNWLKQLIAEHLRRTRFCWQLYPGLLSHRFKRLRALNWFKRIACFPAALAGFFMALASSFLAYASLKKGATDYWPRAERGRLKEFELERATSDA